MQDTENDNPAAISNNWSGEKIFGFISSTELLGNLGKKALHSLADNLEAFELQAGDYLFYLGDDADCMYLLAEGLLDVINDKAQTSIKVAQVNPGECVGELALLGAGKRTATIKAVTDSTLLKLTKESFCQLLNDHSELHGIVRKIMHARIPLLRTISTKLFGDLDSEILSEIESCFFWRQMERGENLYSGQKNEIALYLILHGRLQVISYLSDGSENIVAELGGGQWIGEMALLLDEPCTETIRASRETELIGLTKEGFNKLIEHHPTALLTIIKPIAKRLNSNSSTRIQNYTKSLALNIALISLDDGLFPLPGELLKQLAVSGKTLYLNPALFSVIHGKGSYAIDMDDPRSTYLNEWLSVQEEEHQYIVMESDAKNIAWTKRCLHQADRILFVAKAESDSRLRTVEHLCREIAPTIPSELLLIHNQNSQIPRNTYSWLECRNLSRHHHARCNNIYDLSRVGRLLTDQAIGLVLSGGGARGFAHIGVIKALREANIPIDYVGGTSIGGFLASLVAWDLEHDVLVDYVKQILVNHPRGIHYTIPYSSLMKVRKAEKKIKNLYDGLNIEDLWLNLFTISTNISTSDMVVHKNGPIWKAMRATTAVPGLFPPVFDNGNILVDGGILNNLPIDIIEETGVGHVIASDVTKSKTMIVDDNWQEDLSLHEKILNHFNPFSKPIHGAKASHILTRCMDCTSIMRKRNSMRQTDFYLTPPVGDYSILEMAKIDELIKCGYDYAQDELTKNKLKFLN